MSALTKEERDGLEDVFLSINSSNNKYKYLKDLSSFIFSKKHKYSVQKLMKLSKYRVIETKYKHLLSIFNKKKKNLSK